MALDPVIGGALVSGGMNTASSIIQALMEAGRADEARELIKSWGALDYSPELLRYLGDYTPQALGPSQLAGYQEDPALRAAQMQALQNLQQIQQGGGYTQADRAALEQANIQAGVQARGMRDALSAQMKRRGLSGTGIDIARQQMANQAAAGQQSQQGADIAREGMSRALSAMQQAGQLGGQLRGQEFGQAAQKASAQDIINQFNVENRNRAAQENLGRRYDIQAGNVGAKNQAKYAQNEDIWKQRQAQLGTYM